MSITYSIVNISTTTGFFSESGSSLLAILISADFSEERFSAVTSAASYNSGKRQVGLSISLSYAVLWPSGKFKEAFIQYMHNSFFRSMWL